MILNLAHLSLLVKNYDEAVDFYTNKLGFVVTSDSPMPEMGTDMKWLVISPQKDNQTMISLCLATQEPTISTVGKQGGGYPIMTMFTDDIEKDIADFKSKGVEATMDIGEVPWGKHCMIKDLYGNLIYIVEETKE